MKRKLLAGFIVLAAITGLLAGCAGTQMRHATPEDNPRHHYIQGMEAMEINQIDVAEDKFKRALYNDENFSPALSGLAIVSATKAEKLSDPDMRNVEVSRSLAYLKKARKCADGEEEKFDYYLAVMRVHTLSRDKDWLEKVEDAAHDAGTLKISIEKLPYYQGQDAALYFMGLAYLEALEFQKAQDRFAAILNGSRDGKWHEKADSSLKRTSQIVRAMAGMSVGDVGRKLGAKEAVSRGDLAALLMDELSLERFFAGRIPVESDTALHKEEFTPADVVKHHFRKEILTIMKWRIRGLEPKYDEVTKAYLFKPEESVTRGEMALALEDVLIKLTGDETLATAYYTHEKSPFPDVRNTSPLYNAVINMTTRGIMESNLSGEFRPASPVDGAEALLAIRVLKQKINTY
jgi:tetratricopeptide (TPR) repeat protein